MYVDVQYIQKMLSAHKELPRDVLLSWPSLFAVLDLSDCFAGFGAWAVMFESIKPQVNIEECFDQTFAICLTWIRNLPFMDFSFFKDRLDKALFQSGVNPYRDRLMQDPKQFFHDLNLYLGWDRMCVVVGSLLDDPCLADPDAWRDCLLESYRHIKKNGKTNPSCFRLIEALYAYDLRPEKIEIHSESHFELLGRLAFLLQPRDALVDLPEIDFQLNETLSMLSNQDQNDLKTFLEVYL